MANVSIRGLSKRFGGKVPTTAVDSLDIDIEPGEFLVLLGPSGCGKTTTLRCIAGLESADEGSIAFGERTVFDAGRGTNVPPNKRNIGMVFQSYALWPHMTVRQNIGYPLRAQAGQARHRDRMDRGGRRARRLQRAARPLPRPAERRPAAAGRALARARRTARPRAVRRAAQQPRRAAARPGAQPRSTSCTSGCTSPPSTSPTTRARRSRSGTGSRSCAPARSSSSAAPRKSSRSPRPSTSPVSSAWRTVSRSSARTAAGRTVGEPVKGELGFDDRSLDSLAARTRPEDLQLAKPGTPVAPEHARLHGDRRRLRVRRPLDGRPPHRRRHPPAQPHARRRARQLDPEPQCRRAGHAPISAPATRRSSTRTAHASPPTHADRSPASVVGV